MVRLAVIIALLVFVPVIYGICSDDTAATAINSTAKASEPGKPYTSVIIDVSGLGLQRSMSPRIRNADGSEVWGTLSKMTDKDFDFISDHGLVAYAKTVDEAVKNSRAGLNPMVIQAIGVEGNAHGEAKISNQDAELLKSEDAKGGFLAKYSVIFVNGQSNNTMASAK